VVVELGRKEMNPFAQYRTDGFHKPYRGIPIARLEEFKMFRRFIIATTSDTMGRTAKLEWRYVFRGPRVGNDGFTLKCKANRFDVYCRYYQFDVYHPKKESK